MKTEWNLEVIYTGIDDPAYEADFAALKAAFESLHAALSVEGELERVEAILTADEKINELAAKLFEYLGLRQSVNAEDGDIMAQTNRVLRMCSEAAADEAAASKLLGAVSDIDALCARSEKANSYRFRIEQAKKDLIHMLPDEVEAMVSAMDATGGRAWGDLQSFLTSTVKAELNGEEKTLTQVRNLASDADPAVRRAAYEAELNCYPKIQDSVAFALNNIKNQVTMLAEKRGFASPLDMTLDQSRMQRQTLEAMLGAIKKYLPSVRRYFKHKAEKLGHKNGLPWYDLFAPMGSDDKKYTLEECRDYLVTAFKDMNPEAADMIAEAFDNEWIDFYPRSGKVGGAFCAMAACIKQSRILTNYDGSFGAVDTLAHELGHAYHNLTIMNELPLNRDYPMPIAETASTFNEVHLGEYALKTADAEQRLALLDSMLRETTQCVVDIYSRYLFESAVFEQSRGKFLMAEDLNNLMLDCQKQAYGDGLDPEYLNRGMWVCKSHYYSSGVSFYNFPYAFGNLLAAGLYAMYKEQGAPFIAKYREMLRLTPVHTMEENGRVLGIDLTTPEFWEKSLELVCGQIDEFCRL